MRDRRCSHNAAGEPSVAPIARMPEGSLSSVIYDLAPAPTNSNGIGAHKSRGRAKVPWTSHSRRGRSGRRAGDRGFLRRGAFLERPDLAAHTQRGFVPLINTRHSSVRSLSGRTCYRRSRRFQSKRMLMLVYRCPTTAKVVHSSIEVSVAEVRRLSALRFSLWCPYCQVGHAILGKDLQVTNVVSAA
jgi:hypothetical protein